MDDPKHNPGEPEFGDDHAEDAPHNPGEPQFGDEAETTSPDPDRDDEAAAGS